MNDHETEIQPAGNGYYLIYINRDNFAKAREALKSTGVTLEYGHYTELGNHQETHCSIATVEGILSDGLNDQLGEQGLQVKPDMTWEEMREVAEFYANDDSWTSNYEPFAENFRERFPHLVEPA